MRTLLLASAAVLLISGAAVAQNAGGNPKSAGASNITGSDTHSQLAPQLPVPGQTGSAEDYLQRAERALRARQTGAAQEALERAETRILDRSTAPDQANQPDNGPRVDAIRRALQALAGHDMQGAMSATQEAMAAPGTSGGSMNAGTMGGTGTGTMPATAMPATGGTMTTGTTGTETTPVPSAGGAASQQPMMNMNGGKGSAGQAGGQASP